MMMSRLSIKLPRQAKIIVETGGMIKANDPVAVYDQNQLEYFDLTKHIKLTGSKLYKCLVKKPGDNVISGEIIAVKKSLLGKKFVTSPFTGRINLLIESKGCLEIETRGKTQKILSPVEGRVAAVDSGSSVDVEFEGFIYQAKDAIGTMLSVLEILSAEEKHLDSYLIKGEHAGKILLAFNWPSASVKKAITLDCGIIGVEFENDFSAVKKKYHLDSPSPSVMIIGKDAFYEIAQNHHGNRAVFYSAQRQLIIQNI